MKLLCPKCKAETEVEADPSTDPANSSLCVLTCPECADGSWDNGHHYDAKGSCLDGAAYQHTETSK